MKAAEARRGERRANPSLRHLTAVRGRRQHAVDQAFETLYQEHVADVYQYALAVLANPADAEDVTQQTFLNAYRAFQNGERPHTPHNWLIKIAHNVCRMRWRQSSRRPNEVPLEAAPEPAKIDDEKPPLDELLGALARLPFNQRAAIVMREVEGRSYAEIAGVLETTVPAVEALLFRARTSLKARRDALGILTLVPVPGSLASFFGGGSGAAVAAGGTAIGLDVLLKGAALVATGLVVAGGGFKSVEAIANSNRPHTAVAARAAGSANGASWVTPAERFLGVAANRGTAPATIGFPGGLPRGARAGSAPGSGGEVGADATAPVAAEGAAAGAAAAGAAAAEATGAPAAGTGSAAGAVGSTIGGVVSGVTQTVRTVVGAVPVPSVPPAPVSVPPAPVPVPPPPSLPVTTAIPTLSSPTLTTPTVTTPTVSVPTLP
jgi:RNA polymerase sigma factor (sigma-70 family)